VSTATGYIQYRTAQAHLAFRTSSGLCGRFIYFAFFCVPSFAQKNMADLDVKLLTPLSGTIVGPPRPPWAAAGCLIRRLAPGAISGCCQGVPHSLTCPHGPSSPHGLLPWMLARLQGALFDFSRHPSPPPPRRCPPRRLWRGYAARGVMLSCCEMSALCPGPRSRRLCPRGLGRRPPL